MTDGYSLRYRAPYTVTRLSDTKALMESTGPPEAVWVPDPRPVPDGLQQGFKAPPYVEPEPLRTDTDEWLAVMHRLSDKDRAALSKVVNIANAIFDNDQE